MRSSFFGLRRRVGGAEVVDAREVHLFFPHHVNAARRWMPNPSRTAPDEQTLTRRRVEETGREADGIGIRGAPCPAPIPQNLPSIPFPPKNHPPKLPSRPLQRSGCAEHAKGEPPPHLFLPPSMPNPSFSLPIFSLSLPLGQTTRNPPPARTPGSREPPCLGASSQVGKSCAH